MKTEFHPLIVAPGTFRVALCLSQLGETAWEVLQLSQNLGFDRPDFVTFQSESWAIVLNQQHEFTAASERILAPWDEKLQQLWQAADGHIKINTHFQDCLVSA